MDTLRHFEGQRLRIGIIAALPGELKPLVKDWQASRLKDGTRLWTRHTEKGDVWVAACAGMGAEAARRAFAAAEMDGPLDRVISVGWAGALDAEIEAGGAVALGAVFDARTGERFTRTPEALPFAVVTAPRVADAAEKARLRSAYAGAVMVDMEAATVARLATMRGIPFACVKGVSDGAGAKLPDLNPFIGSKGQLRLLPFVAHLAARPWYWKAVAELDRNSTRAAQAMRGLIIELLEENNVDQLNRARNS